MVHFTTDIGLGDSLTNLFKKVAVFTDVHFGLKSNSKTHLQDCEDFVDWFIGEAKSNGCETGMFCGDWHHNRNSLNLTTMDATIRCLEKLGAAFDNFYLFAGNHDLYYKDKRDVKSTEFARHIPGITVVDRVIDRGNVAMVPWLVDDEWKDIQKIKCKYMFGHFELPYFYMNAMVQMPETGELKAENFKHPELVFSGHFHKRQNKGKIHYIGNAFPHNYADAQDDERGMMILEWDGKPQYIDWPECPKYRTITLSKLLDNKDDIIKNKMYLRVTLDIDISYEEAQFVKETFMNQYDCREITLIPSKIDEEINTNLDITKFESVDQIVSKELTAIQSDVFDNKTLLSIYNNL
jgi:DNA repair exonuclease SbcCD nuclease subunit